MFPNTAPQHIQKGEATRVTIQVGRRTLSLLAAVALLVGGSLLGAPAAQAAAPPCDTIQVAGGDWADGNGVDVRSNGLHQTTGDSCRAQINDLNANPPQYGLGWQCVELAQRMYNARKWHSGLFQVSYASQIYGRASSMGMTATANGSIALADIRPGDMIVTGENTYGHVSLIDHVSGNTVHVVEQNASDSGRATYALSGGTLTRSGFTVLGVVHDPQNTLPASTSVGDHTVGVARPSSGNLNWKLRDSNSGGAPDTEFTFGNATDTAISGDWDGDGDTNVGVVRNEGGNWRWHLRISNEATSASQSFLFGNAVDIPVTGDWDGDGDTNVGVVRPSNGNLRWLLRTSHSAGSATYDFYYGTGTDKPVTGDWDGNGSATAGVTRNGNGANIGNLQWLLRNNHAAGPADASTHLGRSDIDEPVTGDWNGDGETDIGIVRINSEGERQWHIRLGGATSSFPFGDDADKPVTGDWDNS